ncbi:leucine-rich repeat domain-containing protein [Natronospora cellulosivora (SeqCode)]
MLLSVKAKCGVKLGVLLFLLFLLVSTTLVADVYEDLWWNPGLESGIPEREVVANVKDFGAVGDGISDDSHAFQAAIDSVDNGGAVFIPEGRYLICDKLYINKELVLRGAGENDTYLQFDHSFNAIEIIGGDDGSWHHIESGFLKGSTELYVQDPSDFDVGMYVEIQQDNSSEIVYGLTIGNNEIKEGVIGQIVKIKAIESNKIVIDEALRHSYQGEYNPVIRRKNFVENVGFEDFRVRRKDNKPVEDSYVFYFENVANSWIRNISSNSSYKGQVYVNTGYRIEIRDSYFSGSNTYGVDLGFHTSNCLIENNTFSNVRYPMLVRYGANANVFAYNYTEHFIYYGENTGIYLPGAYAYDNLFEGNRTQDIMLGDGLNGPGNTFLRNHLSRKIESYVENQGILIEDSNAYINIIANELVRGNIIWNINESLPYSIVPDNLLIHGNFIDKSVQWDDQILDQTIPVSFYLDEKPDFYGTLNWPSIGSDKINGSIPARERRYGIDFAIVDFLPGDLNGDGFVNSLDVQIFSRYLMGFYEFDLKQKFLDLADLNGDGKVDSLDLSLLQRHILGHNYKNDILVEVVCAETATGITDLFLSIEDNEGEVKLAEPIGSGIYQFTDINLDVASRAEINIGNKEYIDKIIEIYASSIAGVDPLRLTGEEAVKMYQDQVIEFEDEGFEYAIRTVINNGFHPIYLSEVKDIEELLLPRNMNIRSIDGLQYFYNLKILGFGNHISSITEIDYLEENQISDLSSLANLSKLEELVIPSNIIEDISPLAELRNLRILDITNNQVEDISSLSELANLNYLFISHNQILDISPLSNLINLSRLNSSSNQVSDIFALKKLENLTEISLRDNQVTDLSPLENLYNLERLFFTNNAIDDISVFVNNPFPYLTYISIRGNNLDLQSGSEDIRNISRIEDRGIRVIY